MACMAYRQNGTHTIHGIQKTWHTDKMVYRQLTYSMEYTQTKLNKNETYKKTTQKANIENKTNMQKLQDGIIKIVLPLEQELDELKVLELEEYNPSTVH